MLSVSIFYGYFFIMFITQLNPSIVAEDAEKVPITCFHIKHGIIWCSKSSKDLIEQWVSPVDETTDRRTPYKTAMDFFRVEKDGYSIRRFSPTRAKKCFDRSSTSRKTQQDKSQPTISELENRDHLNPFADPPDYLDFGTEKNGEILQQGLQVRNLQGQRTLSKVPGKNHNLVLSAVTAARQQSLQHKSGRALPSVSSSTTTSTSKLGARIRNLLGEIKKGHKRLLNKKKKKSITLAHLGSNHQAQVEVARPKSRTPLRYQRQLSKSPKGRIFAMAAVFPPARVNTEDSAEDTASESSFSTSSTDSSDSGGAPDEWKLTRSQHFMPQNNKIIHHNEDSLSGDDTPHLHPAEWSTPVDAGDLRNRILAAKWNNILGVQPLHRTFPWSSDEHWPSDDD